MPGPKVRTDIVEVYVFRRAARGVAEFLQLRRSKGAMAGSWQPVMGHIEEGETAAAAAIRELKEETGFAPGPEKKSLTAIWQLESVNAFFLATHDAILLSPGFAAEIAPGHEPRLDDTHDAHRWVPRDQADRLFVWPGQRQAIQQIIADIIAPGSPAEPHLRIALPLD